VVTEVQEDKCTRTTPVWVPPRRADPGVARGAPVTLSLLNRNHDGVVLLTLVHPTQVRHPTIHSTATALLLRVGTEELRWTT
jgi:hypothetical protein